jgi:hypothetical protein
MKVYRTAASHRNTDRSLIIIGENFNAARKIRATNSTVVLDDKKVGIGSVEVRADRCFVCTEKPTEHLTPRAILHSTVHQKEVNP